MLAIAVVIVVRTQSKVLTALLLVVCTAMVALREVSITAVARGKLEARVAQGSSSTEYSEGVRDMERYIIDTSAYPMLAVLAVVVMAVGFFGRRGNIQKKPPAKADQ